MDSKFNFVADSVLKGKAYPALAEWQANPYTAEWRQFGQHWPYTVPCELHEHCAIHHFPYEISNINQGHNSQSFYCIGLGFFDFSIDYFDLIPQQVFEKRIKILFYYHEGDNPYLIKQRLDHLCNIHNQNLDCYMFVSGNTAADKIKNFVWFPDHELLYWHRNQQILASNIHTGSRTYKFTLLSRTHKWWRATVVVDLLRQGLLQSSQWSYNTEIFVGEDPADNPLEVDVLGLRQDLQNFLQNGPYICDHLTSDQHNRHNLHVDQHYTQSYCHLVLETHFDADGSNGAFLTEKTFKPIKHGQPFVIIGPAGTLQALRNLGYKTFDHVIDNSYDLETDNNRRWQMILNTIKKIESCDLDQWFLSCLDDIKHNQQHFLRSKYDRLNNLYDKLLHQLATP